MGTKGQKPSITLTFTAADKNTYVQLDSIRVSNISQGVDTVLFYPDTVLVLEYTVGIPGNKKQEEGFRVIQNGQNPVTDQTRISIFVPEKDKVGINVIDVRGRSLLKTDWQLDRGYHSFSFKSAESGLLFLTATWRGKNCTVKILSEGTANRENALVYAGFESSGLIMKSNAKVLGFAFNPGDSLIYIGYAMTPAGIKGSDVLEDRPQSSESYLFEIVEGIPCPGIPAVNYGEQIYTTVQIGTQCWLKEYLNIGSMVDSLIDQTDNGIIEKYCKDNDPDYCSTYGGLYQWAEVVQYLNGATNTTSWYPVPNGNVQGICPSGWHLPSDFEWCTLTTYLDPSVDCNVTGTSGTDVGGKMKETGTLYWDPPNLGATNESGFSARPSSYRYTYGAFISDIGLNSYPWAATEYNSIRAWCRTLYYDSAVIGRNGNQKSGGRTARCIKD